MAKSEKLDLIRETGDMEELTRRAAAFIEEVRKGRGR